MPLRISPSVKAKLASKHGVSFDEVEQAFANRIGGFLEDVREEHQTNPPTWFFIAETDFGRLLKVAFVQHDDDVWIRTAFPPESNELMHYVDRLDLAREFALHTMRLKSD